MAAPVIACPSCGTKNRLPLIARGHPRCASCKTDLPWLVDAGDGDFDQVVDTSALVVVDLWAPWCGPCRMMAPAFQQAATDLEPHARLVKVDTEAEPQLAARFNIRSIPTLALFKGGKEVARQAGAMGAADIVRWTRAHMPG